jgi:hypothetical protein
MLWLSLCLSCAETKKTYTLPSSAPKKTEKETPTKEGQPDEPLKTELPTNEPSDLDMAPAPNIGDGCRVTQSWVEIAPEAGTGILLTGKFSTDQPVTQLIVDFVGGQKNGANSASPLVFGALCPTEEISIEVPKNLGPIQIAFFSDTNGDGPSKDDPQGLSKEIDIKEENIEIGNLYVSDGPIKLFNFEDKSDANKNKETP